MKNSLLLLVIGVFSGMHCIINTGVDYLLESLIVYLFVEVFWWGKKPMLPEDKPTGGKRKIIIILSLLLDIFYRFRINKGIQSMTYNIIQKSTTILGPIRVIILKVTISLIMALVTKLWITLLLEKEQ